MKSALIQFGVRNFNPKLRKARVKLETVRTPEGKSLPPNTIAALRRDMERSKIIKEQIKAIEQTRLQQFEQKPEAVANRMVYLLVRIYGLGWETADLLVHELLSRTLRDRKAVARYAGLTGSPDESGSKRREKGLSRSGNARVRKIMIQLAWRMVSPARQCSGTMVQTTHRECKGITQADDCSACPQAHHCPVALCE